MCSYLYPEMHSEYGRYFLSLAACDSQSTTKEPATTFAVNRPPHAKVLWSITALIRLEGRQRITYRHDEVGGDKWHL